MFAPSELVRPSGAMSSSLGSLSRASGAVGRHHALVGAVIAAAVAAALVGCGDNLLTAPADARAIDASAAVCGDGVLDPGEDCDDGNFDLDMVCDDRCHFTCGNGALNPMVGELCDTAIAAGQPGACPSACSDNMACTTDTLSGSGCQATCMFSPITALMPGDGCCPTGANSTTDADCPVVCGNGVRETGERCDTAIAAGLPGACPTVCNDGFVCTADVLSGMGTCAAECTNTQITMAMNGDGCCPPGASPPGGLPPNDTDCVVGCGNGIINPGETCDTGIAVGPGSCPTSCTDGMACTRDVLANQGTCTAACSFPPIMNPMSGDGCCPAGANSLNDNDCVPRCGNGLAEAGEQCDDGNMVNIDACTNACTLPPTAFRMSDLDLRDPHVFIVPVIGCADVTDTPIAGFAVNPQIQANIQTDADGNGVLDLSPTLVFRPLAQGMPGQLMELHFARCTVPFANPSCGQGTMLPVAAQSTNITMGTCLSPLANTLHVPMPPTSPAYSPLVTTTPASCFVTTPITVNITLSGIPITLRESRIAATYSGNPAQTLLNGLLMGFISEADANTTLLPATLPLIGGKPLSFVLPGGDPPGPDRNCASFSDKDTNNNGVMGWWFYLNFAAPRVTWTGN